MKYFTCPFDPDVCGTYSVDPTNEKKVIALNLSEENMNPLCMYEAGLVSGDRPLESGYI